MQSSLLVPLLSDARTHEPVLPEGLDPSHLRKVPEAGPAPLAQANWDSQEEHPSDLPAQKWAIVVPDSPRGAEMAEAVRALRQWREEEQNAPAEVLILEKGDDVETLARRHQLGRNKKERPRYLLLLGDTGDIGFDIQTGLDHAGCLTGRLCFPDILDFKAYCDKVLAWESRSRPRSSGLVFAAAGTAAIEKPLIEPAAAVYPRVPFAASAPDGLVEAARDMESGVLLTVSHGLACPKGTPEAERRALQGALQMHGKKALDAASMKAILEGQPFLPGGLWFCLACFGAGVPAESEYRHWLDLLFKSGIAQAGKLLENLPDARELPFVASLPQAALASRQGPLGFVGHIDIAWSHAYMNGRDSAPEKVLRALEAWNGGHRAATGLLGIRQEFCQKNADLTHEEEERRRALARGRRDPTDPLRVGELWMARNDLGGFIFLGDPAVRLPPLTPAPPRRSPEVATLTPGALPEPSIATTSAPSIAPSGAPSIATTGAPSIAHTATPSIAMDGSTAIATSTPADIHPGAPPAPTPGAPPPLTANQRETAVLALLAGNETPAAIAAKAGVSLPELWAWLDAYRRAGKRALGSVSAFRRRRA